MYPSTLFSLSFVISYVIAAPSIDSLGLQRKALRLIKVSESDPGTWVTESAKIANYTAKRIGFIDITDIRDNAVLAKLSGSGGDDARIAAVVYPTSVSHQTQANGLIAQLSTTGPLSWLKTLTEYSPDVSRAYNTN